MRRIGLKKVVSVIIMCAILLVCSLMPVMATDIMPYYNNVGYVDTLASISDSGVLKVSYDYVGNSDTTKAVINTLVEKKTLLFFWKDVAEWTDTVYDVTYYDTATLQLEDKGTYRVTVEYTFYGTGGAADTVTHEFEVKY